MDFQQSGIFLGQSRPGPNVEFESDGHPNIALSLLFLQWLCIYVQQEGSVNVD